MPTRARGSKRRLPMAEPIALTALALDAAFGWPRALYRRVGHPVGLFARIIEGCEARWNRPGHSFGVRRALGVLTLLVLLILVAGVGWALQQLLLASLGAYGWIAVAILAWPALAQRSLFDHVRTVGERLDARDLADAQTAVGMIVGRDTTALDEAGVARAAIESLAESFCDGVAAPLFWLLLLGLPGVWAYKAVNTADSLIGHREARWHAFGWAAARTDDLANWIPARLSGLLLCLAGGDGWRVLWRDARKHASPNAGWPEAAMAGTLGLRLAGPITYDGVMHDKPWIGDGTSDAGGDEIDRALAIYLRACLLLWLIAGVIAWLR
jgi:adenosylcobinamide-phosphate synthase